MLSSGLSSLIKDHLAGGAPASTPPREKRAAGTPGWLRCSFRSRGLGRCRVAVSIDRLGRHRGALLGLAAGDALGTTLEFSPPGTFDPIDEMIGRGVFDLEPGQWTDDTSMALCLAESLIECNGFDARDQLHRYLRWYREGHLSSTGRAFDVGGATRRALEKFERTGIVGGETHPQSAGNGSSMRLAPIG
jgi:ADP-ribosyl-[dinitrogen reductase] hydrolase